MFATDITTVLERKITVRSDIASFFLPYYSDCKSYGTTKMAAQNIKYIMYSMTVYVRVYWLQRSVSCTVFRL